MTNLAHVFQLLWRERLNSRVVGVEVKASCGVATQNEHPGAEDDDQDDPTVVACVHDSVRTSLRSQEKACGLRFGGEDCCGEI